MGPMWSNKSFYLAETILTVCIEVVPNSKMNKKIEFEYISAKILNNLQFSFIYFPRYQYVGNYWKV